MMAAQAREKLAALAVSLAVAGGQEGPPLVMSGGGPSFISSRPPSDSVVDLVLVQLSTVCPHVFFAL